MKGIRDKKLWFAVNFGRGHVKCQENSGFALGAGLGILGGAMLAMAFLMAFSVVSEAHASGLHAIVIPVIAGQRASITMKHLRAKLSGEASGLIEKAGKENRELTAEEKDQYESRVKDIKELNPMILDAEMTEGYLVDSVTMDPQARIPKPGLSTDQFSGFKGMPGETEIVSAYGRPKLFKGENAAQKAYAAGMWVLAAIFGREDAKEWCKANGQTLAWVDKNFKMTSQEKTNTGGGFLVPTVLSNMIIDLREQYGLFRQWAKVVPMSSDNVSIPRRKGGLTAYPVGESASGTQSTKAWSQVGLTARKWMVLTKYSSELAEDAIINVAEDLASEVAYAFAFAEDDAGFNGDGTSTYHGVEGIVTKFNNQVSAGSSTYKGALDAASGHDTFAEIDNTDLTNLMALLPKYAETGAQWYISQAGWAATFQRLANTAGGNTNQTLTAAGKPQRMYGGYPVQITQSMPTSVGDLSDKLMILFGDLRLAAALGSRRELALAVSDQVYFETDEIGIRGIERFDINIHDIGDTSTAGPIVGLIGE